LLFHPQLAYWLKSFLIVLTFQVKVLIKRAKYLSFFQVGSNVCNSRFPEI
jgi:hypothetical protein